MSRIIYYPLQPVTFELMSDDVLKPKWQVTLNEDGSLSIFIEGRRNGRLLVEPSSNTSIKVTTDRIMREGSKR